MLLRQPVWGRVVAPADHAHEVDSEHAAQLTAAAGNSVICFIKRNQTYKRESSVARACDDAHSIQKL
jgi:hypothetical protein